MHEAIAAFSSVLTAGSTSRTVKSPASFWTCFMSEILAAARNWQRSARRVWVGIRARTARADAGEIVFVPGASGYNTPRTMQLARLSMSTLSLWLLHLRSARLVGSTRNIDIKARLGPTELRRPPCSPRHMNRRVRHKKNRAAALAVEAETARASTSAARGEDEPPVDEDAEVPAGPTAIPISRFAFISVKDVPKTRHPRGKPKLRGRLKKMGILDAGRGKSFVQAPDLPPSAAPGISAFTAFFNVKAPKPEEDTRAELFTFDSGAVYGDSDDDYIDVTVRLPNESRHHRRRVASHFRWRDRVLPSLVQEFLAQKYSQRPRVDSGAGRCVCGRQRVLNLQLVDWDSACSTLTAGTV